MCHIGPITSDKGRGIISTAASEVKGKQERKKQRQQENVDKAVEAAKERVGTLKQARELLEGPLKGDASKLHMKFLQALYVQHHRVYPPSKSNNKTALVQLVSQVLQSCPIAVLVPDGDVPAFVVQRNTKANSK